VNTLDLVNAVQLSDVLCLELVAQRQVDAAQVTPPPADEPDSGQTVLSIHPVSWGTDIEIWVRAEVATVNANLACTFAVQYERSNEVDIPQEVKTDFIERVVVMAAVPYVREAIHSLGSRLRIPSPLLPVLRQGEFKMNSAGAEEGLTR
jgi:hypothetical protein